MRITPKYNIKNSISEWTLDKLKSNPKLYGGDNGNSEIVLAYIKETNPFSFVNSLTTETLTHATAVSRCKNKLLQIYPQYDYRVKNKPKIKNKKQEDE